MMTFTMKRYYIPFVLVMSIVGACTKPVAQTPDYEFEDLTGPYVPTGEITFKGKVCSGDTPLAGVVVSDGLLCIATDEDGLFELDSDLANTKFVSVSIPEGYKAQSDANGLPQFYHRVTDEEKKANLCEHTFNLEPITLGRPDRYTMLICADPQPRPSSAGFDNIGYHSLDCAEDMYQDMSETISRITDRQVYGLTLGDVTHENKSLYPRYIAGIKKMKNASQQGTYQMHTCIGNHDNDTKAATDEEGRHWFEDYLGPVNYSFNIGKIHFICIDNLIMRLNSSGELKSYGQGLTDELWKWLQNDLRYVDRETTIMMATHSPMFRLSNNSDRWNSNSTRHGYDYKQLLSKYKKVHAWAGHVHVGYWFNYPAGHELENIEVHTLARSTGELWTNDYISASQPRGYIVMDVDGEDVRWYFKPTSYQSGQYSTKTSGMPKYEFRDWVIADDNKTLMLDGKKLDESYQMKVYKPGDYDDSYIYADIFIWEDKWEYPYFEGVKMQKLPYSQSYSRAHKETWEHYYYNGYKLKGDAGYLEAYSLNGAPASPAALFRIYDPRETGSGTVTVKDRFGNVYSRTISW